jgi:hypothetical protein
MRLNEFNGLINLHGNVVPTGTAHLKYDFIPLVYFFGLAKSFLTASEYIARRQGAIHERRDDIESFTGYS